MGADCRRHGRYRRPPPRGGSPPPSHAGQGARPPGGAAPGGEAGARPPRGDVGRRAVDRRAWRSRLAGLRPVRLGSGHGLAAPRAGQPGDLCRGAGQGRRQGRPRGRDRERNLRRCGRGVGGRPAVPGLRHRHGAPAGQRGRRGARCPRAAAGRPQGRTAARAVATAGSAGRGRGALPGDPERRMARRRTASTEVHRSGSAFTTSLLRPIRRPALRSTRRTSSTGC